MNTQTDVVEVVPVLPPFNNLNLALHEVPALAHVARDAIENHHVGVLSTWMLGAAIIGVLGGTSVYFLAVSPYVISVLAPFFQAQ